MTLPTVFSFTDILWLVADAITIETAGGNGDRHLQTNYWTEGGFLPGCPQLADTGVAGRDEDIDRCCCHRDGFDTLCGLPDRRLIPAQWQPDTAMHTLQRPSGRRFC